MDQNVRGIDGLKEAPCTACSEATSDHEWETDTGPDGEENIRFCPQCGEQVSFSLHGTRV